MNHVWPYLAALIPFVGMGWLFWLVMKNVVEADRTERRAHSLLDREAKTREKGEKEHDRSPHEIP